jgi:predicted site-specific integrase-resolvase
MNGSTQPEHSTRAAFEETHFAVRYWAERWGFSVKTVREWFRDEYGPGILRQTNAGRRSKRDYTTIMVSPSAAARVYAARTAQELIH